MRERIEEIGSTFLAGYRAAMETDELPELTTRLYAVPRAFQGFAFEGAAMALALLDRVTPWNQSRFRLFLAGPGQHHIYMLHVGVGWLLGRFPFSIRRMKARLDPLLCWLALDGYGFHEGYFRWPRYIDGAYTPARLKDYDLRCFDQGLGRSLWFVLGGDTRQIPAVIERFPEARQGDLWSGVGLAATYAGEVKAESLEILKAAANTYSPQLAQGAAFAAKARLLAGNPTDYSRMAARILCARPLEEAAELTDKEREALPASSAPTTTTTTSPPLYEIWRQRIQKQFQAA